MRPPIPIPANRYEELLTYQKQKRLGIHEYKRFLCVFLRLDRGMTPKEISHTLGIHANTVRIIQRDFILRRTKSFSGSKCGGRYRQLMTPEEEKAFLATFEEPCSNGSMIVIRSIKAAFEKRVGYKVHKSTIYRILYRNGWRKIVPRPKHPKQSKEALESFKKRALPKE